MTLIWFLIWLIADNTGDPAPLCCDPVNFWCGALLFAAAVDINERSRTTIINIIKNR